MQEDTRPNPDALLTAIQREEEKGKRGHLKIFFGACAGVGKTYALLSNAQTLREQGIDLVIGVVESHGRRETAELAKNLETIPLKTMLYREKKFFEFDLDAALLRKPALILIDELAHTNVTGSRHKKRWQDVEELLNAGIDVHTTVNVQHLESLKDVVAQITGIRVSESFPDHVFDMADEVTLVDLPPEELLQRLEEGKIYIPEQTPQAIQNFFKKGNLIALRELALRRMADRVDVQMQEYRTDQSIERVWPLKERLLVCVGPQANSEKIIRAAYRLAQHLRANWYAVYVETPALQKLSSIRRSQIFKNLKLAESLGAETSTLAGTDCVSTLLSYAHHYNITKIMVGRSPPKKWFVFWRTDLSKKLSDLASDIDIYVVGQEKSDIVLPSELKTPALLRTVSHKTSYKGYLGALLCSSLTTIVSVILFDYFGFVEPDIVMLFLLNVVTVAMLLGRNPSILASFASVALFDFFFIPPHWTFTVEYPHAIITFGIMLFVGLTISTLTANLRYQAHISGYREQRIQAAYALNKELSSVLLLPQLIEISSRHLHTIFQAKISIWLPDHHGKVHSQYPLIDPNIGLPDADKAIAQWVYDNYSATGGTAAGWNTETLSASPILYLPAQTTRGIQGVLAILPKPSQHFFLPEQQRLLDSFAGQIALTLERIHDAETAKNTLLTMESEHLRNVLLTAIARDLQAPLNDILNLSQTLFSQSLTVADKKWQELTKTIPEKIQLINSLINNLLDMARLQIEETRLNKQLNDFNQVLQNVLQIYHYLTTSHHVTTHIPSDLLPFYFDAPLIQRVLSNLLENAGKYTPTGSTITLTIERRNYQLWIILEDNGSGFPKGMEEEIFKKFTRGQKYDHIPGAGLGLAICRAIIEAHRGHIHAENRPEGGARFVLWLPFEIPSERSET